MQKHRGLAEAIRRALSGALDCLMPPYDGVRELESMDAASLVAAIAADPESKRHRQLPIEGLVYAFPYRARLAKAAIVEIKTNMNQRVVRILAEAAYLQVRDRLAAFAAEALTTAEGCTPILAPVPMTRRRRRERGWNQCELLATEWNRLELQKSGVPSFIYMKDALRRTRETSDQVGMGKEARAANMRGSFGAGIDAGMGASVMRGRDVIILDDVATTGATLREARAAAIASGARRVLLVSIGY